MGTTFKYNDKLNILGDIIKQKREEQNISVEQLSTKLSLLGINLPADSLYQIENKTRTIKDYELAGISYLLKISTDKIFDEFINNIKHN